MSRDNPNYPPWHCFTACLCEKCKVLYEADREHICRKKNSYPVKETKGKTIKVKQWEYKEESGNNNRCVSCGEIIPEGRQVCPHCETKIKEPTRG